MIFEIGDVVVLKSGGSLMTVAEQEQVDGRAIKCVWFVGSYLLSNTFRNESLRKATDAEMAQIVGCGKASPES